MEQLKVKKRINITNSVLAILKLINILNIYNARMKINSYYPF